MLSNKMKEIPSSKEKNKLNEDSRVALLLELLIRRRIPQRYRSKVDADTLFRTPMTDTVANDVEVKVNGRQFRVELNRRMGIAEGSKKEVELEGDAPLGIGRVFEGRYGPTSKLQ